VRTTTSLLAVALALTGCKGGSQGARRSDDAGAAVVVIDQTAGGAPIVAEKEPNDDPAAGQLLSPPGGVKGAIDKAGDVDVYSVEIAQAGVLSVKLSALADADLTLEITDAAGARLVISDNGPKNTAEGVPNWVAQPGAYRVIVREFVKKPAKAQKKAKAKAPDAGPASDARQAPSAAYTIEAQLGPMPAADEELEPNESAAFARELPLPGSARGFVGWRKDRDVWQVRLADVREDEALNIDVDGVAEVALRVAVLDGTEAVLLERQGRAGEAVQVKNVAVRAGEPHYYVAVSATGRANFDEKYEVRATVAPLELDEETEPNDDVKRAGLLADVPSDTGTRVGYLARGDTDVYKLEAAAAPRELHLTVEPPSGVDVVLSVVDEAGAPIAPSVDGGGAGAVERLGGVIGAANQAVFVKLTGKAGEGGERYRLRWSAAPVPEATPVPGVDDVVGE
jgi:hypothetical protein